MNAIGNSPYIPSSPCVSTPFGASCISPMMAIRSTARRRGNSRPQRLRLKPPSASAARIIVPLVSWSKPHPSQSHDRSHLNDYKAARAGKNGYSAQCSTANLADGDSPQYDPGGHRQRNRIAVPLMKQRSSVVADLFRLKGLCTSPFPSRTTNSTLSKFPSNEPAVKSLCFFADPV